MEILQQAGEQWTQKNIELLQKQAQQELVTQGLEQNLPSWVTYEGIKSRLWQGHWMQYLWQRIQSLYSESGLTDRPTPHFIEEITPSLRESLHSLMQQLNQLDIQATSHDIIDALLQIFDQIQINGILLLLGQRRTSASYTSILGLPPAQSTLIQSVTQLNRVGQKLTVGGRALTKHAVRSVDPWWGIPKGNDEIKNQHALQLVHTILEQPTWWNVFHHYKQQVVFEVREPLGHGVRWGQSGQALIGFLEPFDEDKGGTPKRQGE